MRGMDVFKDSLGITLDEPSFCIDRHGFYLDTEGPEDRQTGDAEQCAHVYTTRDTYGRQAPFPDFLCG